MVTSLVQPLGERVSKSCLARSRRSEEFNDHLGSDQNEECSFVVPVSDLCGRRLCLSSSPLEQKIHAILEMIAGVLSQVYLCENAADRDGGRASTLELVEDTARDAASGPAPTNCKENRVRPVLQQSGLGQRDPQRSI